jgi:hypothetical protein
MTMCWGCHKHKDTVHTDVLGRRFCKECSSISKIGTNEILDRAFLLVSVPFAKGDRVDCRLAGTRYEGRGTITTVSMDIKDGGTPVNPIFHVALDGGARDGKHDGWFCEHDLTKVS